MPFIGRDWRANGEQWTKTEVGSWERPKRISLINSSIHCNSSLSDVFNALDFISSVDNIRRFDYVSKVVQILFQEKLSELSGNAQRSLLQVIEKMFDMALKTGDNISLMQDIVTQFPKSIHSAYPFYYYIGSAALWRQHIDMLTRMQETIEQVRADRMKSDENNSKSTLDHLPGEMQHEIIKRLDNGKDLVHLGMMNSKFYRMTQEFFLWQQLCLYHFGEMNKNLLTKQQKKDFEIDWKGVYFKMKKRHGLREVYAEMIEQCQSCKHLVWQNTKHSCPYETLPPTLKPITPRILVNMLI